VNKGTQPPTSHRPSGGVMHFGASNLSAERFDPYQAKGKYHEPTVCSDCGAVYHAGRWQWSDAPAQAPASRCPACKRIREKMPAGTIVLEGEFVAAHHDEIVGLVRHEAERERLEHPMHRVIELAEQGPRINVATTDIHTPQRIGEALKRAYDGELTVKYAEAEYAVRAHWRR
jgi:hypothetical protein